MAEPFRVVSFGAGVQSTTLMHLVIRELLPRPDCFIFADTHCEPLEVYGHLANCRQILEFYGIPLHVVSAGDLMKDVLAGVAPEGYSRDSKAGHYTNLPAFIKNEDGSIGLGSRHCTKDYKIVPIRRKIRELLGQGTPDPGAVEQWFGISLDEASRRMRASDVQYIRHRYPLVYDFEWTRQKCKAWLTEVGAGVPERSACFICPYHSNAEWRRLRQDDNLWEKAVAFDASIRNRKDLKGEQFLHRDCVPLDQVDLSTEEERGQGVLFSGCSGLECWT